MKSAASSLAEHTAGPAVPDRDGLRERCAELFAEHGRFVWRVLRRMGVAEADVEDVCQDVFLTVHEKLANFEQRSSSRTWIYGICLRIAANYRRRSYRRREQTAEVTRALQQQRSDSSAELTDLDRALAGLSEAKRAVFVLYEFGELTMAEVAEVVGSPVKTCFSRLHAARRELRQALQAAAGREP